MMKQLISFLILLHTSTGFSIILGDNGERMNIFVGNSNISENHPIGFYRCEDNSYRFIENKFIFNNTLANQGTKTPCDYNSDVSVLKVISDIKNDISYRVESSFQFSEGGNQNFAPVCTINVSHKEKGRLFSYFATPCIGNLHKSHNTLVKKLYLLKQGLYDQTFAINFYIDSENKTIHIATVEN